MRSSQSGPDLAGNSRVLYGYRTVRQHQRSDTGERDKIRTRVSLFHFADWRKVKVIDHPRPNAFYAFRQTLVEDRRQLKGHKGKAPGFRISPSRICDQCSRNLSDADQPWSSNFCDTRTDVADLSDQLGDRLNCAGDAFDRPK
jgi:hypothetical protein